MKELLSLIVIPEDQSQFEYEVACIIDWYNESRPHMTLDGKTPNETHFLRQPANEQPRVEPRKDWPRGLTLCEPAGRYRW